MILAIGFEKEEFSRIKDALSEFEIHEVPEYCRDWVVAEVVQKARSFEGSGNWHWRKFILMHDLSNENVKEVIQKVKGLGIPNVIFATTTPTSLSWMLEDLLKELVKEDEHFRKLKEEQQKMKTFYLDIGKG